MEKKGKKDKGHGDHGGGEDSSSSSSSPDERKLLVMVAWLFFANLFVLAWNVGALDFLSRQP